MNKLLIIFLFSVNSIYHAQDIRFTYNYKYVADTLKKDVVSNEVVVLDFNNKAQQSIFTGLKHIASDSTMTADAKRGIMTFPDTSMKIRYVIEKKINDNTLYFYTPNHAPDNVLKVKDNRKINWKILNEKENVLGYTVQKATTFFAGRQWTAWFSTEIPIQDGPYKFYGLPGLILKISDKTNTHSFEIISVLKQKSDYFVLNDDTYKEIKQISLNVYEKNKLYNTLEQSKKKMLTEGIFRSIEEKQKFLKDIDIQIKESKIHDNNPIELLPVEK